MPRCERCGRDSTVEFYVQTGHGVSGDTYVCEDCYHGRDRFMAAVLLVGFLAILGAAALLYLVTL